MPYTEFYVQPSGSNLNAGSTPDDAAPFTYAGGTFVRATRVFTVASGNPLTDGVTVGMWISVYTTSGATVATCVGRVDNVTSTTIRFDATAIAGAVANVSETAAAATAKIGGAWAGPATTQLFPWGFVTSALLDTSSNPPRVNIKNASTYEQTAAGTHANNGAIFWEGYASSIGDGGIAKFGGNSAAPSTPYVMLTISATGNYFKNLWWENNGGTTLGQTVNGLVHITGTSTVMERCRFTHAYRGGLTNAAGGNVFIECEAYDNQFDDASAHGNFETTEESTWVRCFSYYTSLGPRGTGPGGTNTWGRSDSACYLSSADSTEPVVFIECIALNAGNHGWQFTGNHNAPYLYRCVSYLSQQAGVHFAAAAATASPAFMESCVFAEATTFGVSAQNATHRTIRVSGCAFWSNTSGDVDPDINAAGVRNSISLGADPFRSALTGDFRLVETTNAELHATGVGSFLINTSILADGANSVSRPAVGAIQPDALGVVAVSEGMWDDTLSPVREEV